MAFVDHLAELRRRLIRALVVLIAASAGGFAVAGTIIAKLLEPYGELLIVIGPTEGISTYLRVALAAGGTVCLPYALAELWGFVRPGLRPEERRSILFLLPAALALFALGVAFTWLVLVPVAVRFLAGLGPAIFRPQWTAERYVHFVTSLLFWTGVSFEMPVLVFALARLRIVSARQLARAWRPAVVLIAVAAAAITPTVDPFTMLLVSGPLLLLYGVSIGVAAVAAKHKEQARVAPRG